MAIQDHGTPFSATASGTSVATATYAGTTNQLLFVTDIAASSTGLTTGTWAVLAGASGNTVIWAGEGAVNYKFSEPLRISSGQTVKITANGTTATYANIAGFYVMTK